MHLRSLILPALCTTAALGMGPITIQAQQVVASGGAYHQGGGTSISYTVGEPVITTVSAAGNTLTQGFQQPWADITTLVEEPSPGGTITVYPNPVRHTLHIALGEGVRADSYMLHDASGRLVTDGRLSAPLTNLDMERHASGNYFLRVSGPDNSLLQTFKITITR